MEYIAYLHKDKSSDYGVSFPDFPGCITAGRTLEEARKLAVEALKLHMAGMIESSPGPWQADRKKGAVAFLVSVEAPEKNGSHQLK